MEDAWLILSLALGLLALALAAVGAWLWGERARLRGELSASTQRLQESQARADEHDANTRALQHTLDTTEESLASLRVSAAEVRARLDAATIAGAEARDALEARHRAELAALGKAAKDKDDALQARLDDQQRAFRETIEAQAARAMKQSGEQLLTTATQVFTAEQDKARGTLEAKLAPIAQTLARADEKLAELERQRVAAYASLQDRTTEVARGAEQLRQETARLFRALSKPNVRGRYGEVQLRRVLELSGMREYCDFDEQRSERDDDEGTLRPDVVVRLPNNRCIVIDAKANLDAYLQALDAAPDEAEAHLQTFADHVAEQARRLASKQYQSRLDGAAEFVVMFVPGDQFVDAALQRRPSLLEHAFENRVILASPSTLIGLLSAVHAGWRERRLADSAEELRLLGRELHERVEKVLRDVSRLGGSLDNALKAYNDVVGSIDARLMPTMRKFEESGARSDRTIPDIKIVDGVSRPLRALPDPREQSAP